MGQMIDGVWSEEDILSEIAKDGSYVKKPSVFRNAVTADGSTPHPAEAGRYILYSSVACPWAQRTLLFRTLKKLENVIPLFNTVKNAEGGGWWFDGEKHAVPGTDQSVQYLHEIYAIADPHYTGRVTVPTLWDSQKQTVVCNESSEIIRMFNGEFSAFTEPAADLYPASLQAKIDEMNDLILGGVNNAVNGCGRSKSQQAYEASYDLLFSTFDQLEALLSKQRFLCGTQQTEADWRLFPTLVRFDSIYYIGYKCNKQRLEDYPNLSAYLRDLYQSPGIAEICDLEQMKRLIFRRGGPIGSNGIVPKGPQVDFNRPHNRQHLGA